MMSTARRFSTNSDAVTGLFRRVGAILVIGFAMLAALPGTAHGEDITISWEHAAYSVHEGDPLAVVISFSDVLPQGMVDEQVTSPEWYLTVRVTRTDRGGARQQSDYYGPGASFKMYAGERNAVMRFDAIADDVVDPGESVAISFVESGLPAGVRVVEPRTTVVNILDGPSGSTATLNVSPDSISENGGVSTVTASLNRAASEDVTLNVAAAPGTGAAASDFTLSGNTTLTIAEGQTSSSGAVTITARNNTIDAPDKTVDVTASVTAGPSNLRSPSGRTLIITDDEATPTVTLELSPTSISEDSGVSTVTARLSHATSEDVTLDVSATPLTGAGAFDFELSSNTTLTIAKDQTRSTGTVTVTAEDNTFHAPDKTVEVSAALTAGPADMATPTAQTLTITDNEVTPTVTLKLDPTSITENSGRSTVTASISGASSEDVTVDVAVTPLTGAIPTDYILSGNTRLTIAKGQTESAGTVTVTGEDNNVDAPDKMVRVSASVTAGGVSAPAAQTLTITDDEATPTLTLALSPSTIPETSGTSTVTASLNRATSEAVTVTVSSSPVSPAGTGDFTQTGTTLTITAGSTTSIGTVTIAAENDAVDTPNKEVTVTGSVTAGPAGMSAPAAQTLTITDDEATPTVTLMLSPSRIPESAGVSTVTASLNRATSEAVTVTVSSSPVSPAGTGDFTQTGTTLTFTPGSKSSTGAVTIAAENDAVDTPNKEVTVTGSVTAGPAGMSAPANQTLTITDDEAAPTVTLLLSPSRIPESAGVSTVTASLNRATSEAVTVTVSSSPVSPAGTGDFTQTGTTLTFTPGSKSSTGAVTIAAENDAVDTPNKEVTVTGSVTAGPAGMSAPANQTLTITDDEAAPTVTLLLSPSRIPESAGVSTVTASLNRATSEAVTVTVSSSPVSPAGTGDFTQTGTTLTFTPGSKSSTGAVTIAAENDAVDTPNKQVIVSGVVTTGPAGVSAPAAQTLTITDDEAPPTVTLVLTPNEIGENGGGSTVTARMTGVSSETVTVTVTASAVLPAVSDDFTLTGTTLTIDAGETESRGSVRIAAKNNNVDAPNKQVSVRGTVSGGNGVSAPAAVTLTITDDEGAPTVRLVLTPDQISENGGSSTVTAELTGASSETVTVTVTVSPVSPAETGDFELTGTTLTIDAGETESTDSVQIAAKDNDIDSPNKQVTVRGSVSGGNGVSVPAARTLTITDDETVPTVTLVLAPDEISENGGPSTVTAELSGASSERVTVTVSASAVSPAVTGDFELTGTTLTIDAGDTTSTGNVQIAGLDNDEDAPDKTVRVTASVAGGNGVSAPTAKTLTITDDEGLPTLSLVLAPPSIGENGGESTVTAELTGASSETVTVTVTAAAVQPAVSDDYELRGTTLTIRPGETKSAGTVLIAARNNDVDAPNKTVRVNGSVSGGNGVAAPAEQTLTITDDETMPTVTLVLTPEEISEDGGSSTVMAELSGLSSEAVTVTVSAAAVPPAVSDDFELTGTTLTIGAGQARSTGSVRIAAKNNPIDAPNKQVTVTGSVSGGNGVSAPAAKTLTITDDEGAPTVTLVLTPEEISENGGSSMVTAELSGLSSEAVTVSVSAAAVLPAVSDDFELTGTTLTIGVGDTESTGSVRIRALNNDEDAPNKTVRVTATASGGNGVSAPAAKTLTITDDETVADGDAGAGA